MDDQLERPLKGLLSITTPDDYEMALSEIEELVDLDPVPQSFFGRELTRLATLTQEYERKNNMCPSYELPATPSSPKTGTTSELLGTPNLVVGEGKTFEKMLDDYTVRLIEHQEPPNRHIDAKTCPWCSARKADLLALWNNREIAWNDRAQDWLAQIDRQREEIERLDSIVFHQNAEADLVFQASEQGQELIALRGKTRELSSQLKRLEAEQTPRPLQTSVQWEPPYPDHETAIVSIRYPYHTAHKPTTLCAIQEPHLIEDCGEFER